MSLVRVANIAARATELADELAAAVAQARRAGYAWDNIARTASPGGRALGTRFPGGTSATTFRRMYEAGSA